MLLALCGCATGPGPSSDGVALSGLVWDYMSLAGAEDAYVFDSLAAAVDGATAVVAGGFVRFEIGEGSAAVDGVLQIDVVLAGSLPTGLCGCSSGRRPRWSA